MAAVLVVFVAMLCLTSFAPTAGADSGCQGFGLSPRICGQSGASDPISVVLQDGLLVQWRQAPTAWLPAPPLPRSVWKFHAGPSDPRAPPLSLV